MVRVSLAFIDGLGTPEMILIFVIVLVLFGGQKLPEFARGLGKSIREFKKAAAGVEEEFKRALEQDEHKHVTPKIAAPATHALGAATSVAHGDAGPEAIVHDYDEYGHEIVRSSDVPGESGTSVAVADTVPSESVPYPVAEALPPPSPTIPGHPETIPAATSPAPISPAPSVSESAAPVFPLPTSPTAPGGPTPASPIAPASAHVPTPPAPAGPAPIPTPQVKTPPAGGHPEHS